MQEEQAVQAVVPEAEAAIAEQAHAETVSFASFVIEMLMRTQPEDDEWGVQRELRPEDYHAVIYAMNEEGARLGLHVTALPTRKPDHVCVAIFTEPHERDQQPLVFSMVAPRAIPADAFIYETVDRVLAKIEEQEQELPPQLHAHITNFMSLLFIVNDEGHAVLNDKGGKLITQMVSEALTGLEKTPEGETIQ